MYDKNSPFKPQKVNKALDACIRYERARTEIKRLTQGIRDVGELECDQYNTHKDGPLAVKSCLERLWEWNRVAKVIADEEEYGDLAWCDVPMIELPEETQPMLCPRCSEVDKLIQLRKAAKKEYGIAKRVVSAIGRGALQPIKPPRRTREKE